MWSKHNKKYTDMEIIMGIQAADAAVEKAFFDRCRAYFAEHRTRVFDSPASRAVEPGDVFQDAFLKLWTEIGSHKIYIRDAKIWRTDRNGNPRRFTASLTTYLMAVARYRNYELERDEELYVDEVASGNELAQEAEPDLTPEWIVQQCVEALPQRCKEILTLFYYEDKSLDEILEIRKEHISKDGLKSGKHKCMTQLKERIISQFRLHNLNLPPHD